MSERTALFRCDASPAIGGGHVMRCLTLADALAERGFRVAFLVREGTEATVPALGRSAHRVIAAEGSEYDLVAAARAAGIQDHDLVVVDAYPLSAPDETRLRTLARHVVVIDDLADRPHDCDLLIDQNLGRRAEHYRALVPEPARLLIGPRFALLRPDFARWRAPSLARRDAQGHGTVRRILISLGLTDALGLTPFVLEAALAATAPRPAPPAIDVVLGSSAATLAALRERAAGDRRIMLHVDTPDMARLMADADVSIGAAGSTSWERCCLGVPGAVVVLAGNQTAVAAALAAAGATIVWDPRPSDVAAAAADIAGWLADGAALDAISQRARAICDGEGARRSAAWIAHHLLGSKIGLRPIEDRDSADLLAWRNDPVSRASSRNTDLVAQADHDAWFARVRSNPDTVVLIVDSLGRGAGVVRFNRTAGASWEISINLAPELRGLGVGAAIIDAGCERLRALADVDAVTATVREDNPASLGAFRSAGFGEVGRDGPWVVLRRAGR